MKITCLSKREFEDVMRRSRITNENVEERKASFLISVCEPKNSTPYFNNKENVKVLKFYDIDKDTLSIKQNGEIEEYKAFTIEQARDLFNFIKKHKDKSSCIIHCYAGISRSGAIGSFICDYIGEDYELFKRTNPQVIPNQLVLKLLRQAQHEDDSINTSQS